jgi:hypothetical protein
MIPIQKIPRFIPHTNPTPPDESNTAGQVFFRIRMNPTSPDQSDRLQPPHNLSVVGSIPTGPINQAVSSCLTVPDFDGAYAARRRLLT